MPFLPNFIERFAFFRLNAGPAPLIDMWAAVGFRLALAASRLDLFNTLEAGPLPAEGLAQKLNAHPQATAILLDALESLGYVRKRGDRYHNTAMTRKWMLSTSANNFAHFHRYWGDLLEKRWDTFEETLRSGYNGDNLYFWLEDQPDTSHHFQSAMISIANFSAASIVGKINLPATARRLLDLGGGHGTYSIALCEKYPALSATILDSPRPLETGRANVAARGMADRISLQPGDFLNDDLGTGYDAVLCFNIVHGLTAEQNLALLRRVRGALNPGGQVIIAEQLADSVPLPLAKATMRVLSMSYYHLLGGRAYASPDFKRWLGEAGFGQVKTAHLRTLGSSLISGTAQGR